MAIHECFACHSNNQEQIVTKIERGWVFNFAERYTGPSGRAHGGIAIGSLTCPALQMATNEGMSHPEVLHVHGRLNLPVPLAVPIPAFVRHDMAK